MQTIDSQVNAFHSYKPGQAKSLTPAKNIENVAKLSIKIPKGKSGGPLSPISVDIDSSKSDTSTLFNDIELPQSAHSKSPTNILGFFTKLTKKSSDLSLKSLEPTNGRIVFQMLFQDLNSVSLSKFIKSFCEKFAAGVKLDQNGLSSLIQSPDESVTPALLDNTLFKSVPFHTGSKESKVLCEVDGELSKECLLYISDLVRLFTVETSKDKVRVGVLHYEGKYLPKDYSVAYKWFSKACKNDDYALAYVYQGVCHLHGHGTPMSEEKAFRAFYIASKMSAPHPLGQLYLSRCFRSGISASRDSRRALRWLEIAAEVLPQAQYDMGEIYYYGKENKDVDYALAVEYFKKAAIQGHRESQFRLGRCYGEAVGVELNLRASYHFYQQAALQGHASAQSRCGYMLEHGIGIEMDLDMAVGWYEKAVAGSSASAQNHLGFLYRYGKGVDQNEEIAFNLFSLSAEAGNKVAQNHLGQCYESGSGCEQDMEKAVYWYRKSALQGYAPAQNNLALCFELGKGVGINIKEAVRLYRLSAEQGNSSAQFNLGDWYQKTNNLDIAVEWFSRAAAQGDFEAQTRLEFCHSLM
ncbi:hypothetical protein HDV04_000283 [Boothiomyces sp. JEL0838]|nr:hypothetical protein HDV04_000283 [Boothiomyces sp. JEL0838]